MNWFTILWTVKTQYGLWMLEKSCCYKLISLINVTLDSLFPTECNQIFLTEIKTPSFLIKCYHVAVVNYVSDRIIL